MLGLLIFYLPGCLTIRDPVANNISYIGLTNKPKSGTSIGPVTSKDCANVVMGYPSGDPQIDNAFKELEANRGIKYLLRVSIVYEYNTYGFWGENSVLVKGEGFR